MGPALADGRKTLLWYFVGAGAVDKYTFPRRVAELHEYVNRIGEMIKYTFKYNNIVIFGNYALDVPCPIRVEKQRQAGELRRGPTLRFWETVPFV